MAQQTIEKVIIESSSAYFADYGCTDRLAITKKYIEYRKKINYHNGKEESSRWRYSTDNNMYQDAFEKICKKMLDIFSKEYDLSVCDCSVIEFSIIYADKQKITQVCCEIDSDCRELFETIQKLVPPNEGITDAYRVWKSLEELKEQNSKTL